MPPPRSTTASSGAISTPFLKGAWSRTPGNRSVLPLPCRRSLRPVRHPGGHVLRPQGRPRVGLLKSAMRPGSCATATRAFSSILSEARAARGPHRRHREARIPFFRHARLPEHGSGRARAIATQNSAVAHHRPRRATWSRRSSAPMGASSGRKSPRSPRRAAAARGEPGAGQTYVALRQETIPAGAAQEVAAARQGRYLRAPAAGSGPPGRTRKPVKTVICGTPRRGRTRPRTRRASVRPSPAWDSTSSGSSLAAAQEGLRAVHDAHRPVDHRQALSRRRPSPIAGRSTAASRCMTDGESPLPGARHPPGEAVPVNAVHDLCS